MSVRSLGSDSGRDFNPSKLEMDADWLFEQLGKLRVHEANRVHGGLTLMAPTTLSSQAVGAGNTEWKVDLLGGMVTVDGVMAEIADTPDLAVHTGSKLLDAGQSVIAAIVVKNNGGALSVVVAKGAAATTGAQKEPSNAVIEAAVTGGKPWIKLADITLNRAADFGGAGVITQAQDNTQRPVLGITVDAAFADLSVL